MAPRTDHLFFDYETYLIRPGLTQPKAVCLAVAMNHEEPRLLGAEDARGYMFRALRRSDIVFVGHNVMFDLLVAAHEDDDPDEALTRVFEAVGGGRVHDTSTRFKLLTLATTGRLMPGMGSLLYVAKAYKLGDVIKAREQKHGADSWRLGYNELARTPVDQWPEDARAYPISDVDLCRRAYKHQLQLARNVVVRGRPMRYLEDDGRSIHDEHRHNRADLALKLAATWGVRVHPGRWAALDRKTRTELETQANAAMGSGLLVRKADGTIGKSNKALLGLVEKHYRDQAEALAAEKGSDPDEEFEALTAEKRTEKGRLSTSKDTLESLGNPALAPLLAYRKAEKFLSTYVDTFGQGRFQALCCGYDVIKDTGRTSSFAPNIQNVPRKGGLRECLEPRRGWVFVVSDYDSIELRAWAEVCMRRLGHSTLADRYGEDPDFDPHTYFAAHTLGIDYATAMSRKAAGDKEVKGLRQLSKIPNFGYPGGMGAKTLVEYARGYGVTVSEEQAQRLKDTWFEVWSEAKPYLRSITDDLRNYGWDGADGETVAMVQEESGRVRAGCRYTQAANTLFQGLTADGAKLALWEVSRRCYTVPSSALFGCRMVAFIHDELVLEAPEDRASEAADELAQVMREQMARVIRSVPIRTTPVVTRVWTKDAVSERGADGRWSIYTCNVEEDAVDAAFLAEATYEEDESDENGDD